MNLYRFEKNQLVINIAGTRFGGQPGEFPTVLCGTIFYHGHDIVRDADHGVFDRFRAEMLVSKQAELSDNTGNPSVLHIYGRTAQAFERYLCFAEDCWDGPIIIDSADAATRMFMCSLVSEIGFADKSIFNSISLATRSDEALAIKDSEVDSTIILAYNPADSSIERSLSVLEDGAGVKEKGLLHLARDLGLTNLLVDPGVVPLGNGAGSALRFSVVAKAKFGLPVGSGIHNAVSSWTWLKNKGRENRLCCDAAAAAMQVLSSGDFLLYGPIDHADFIFPAVAMADIMVAEAVKDLDIWSVPEHPLHRLV
ncbi:MAG: tetrahydromethanopterin S-methyltransferase subunit H [Methanotrichaceae archaeon]|nr:tetrahydromethanopterin S-methyltransferase subunit H [Methanotrichaceae archaeon]